MPMDPVGRSRESAGDGMETPVAFASALVDCDEMVFNGEFQLQPQF
jgi:hypothetical protein